MMRRPGASRVAGFTLVEALAATLLMGMILAALATVTAQWLPNWNRGFARTQRVELLATTIERLTADFSAAVFVSPNRKTDHPLFEGTEVSVTFVRSAIGPDARSGLDFVRVSQMSDGQGPVLIRTRASFAPGYNAIEQIPFADPVVLLRAPYRLSFAFADKNRVWRSRWSDASILPSFVRLNIRDAVTDRVLPVSTVATVHADLPAGCINADDCNDTDETDEENVRREAGGGGSSAQPGQ